MLQPLPVNNTNQQDDITITKHKLMVQYAVVPKTYVNDIESFVSKHIILNNIVLLLLHVLVETRQINFGQYQRLKVNM